MIKFMRGFFKLPIFWQVWVGVLFVVNGVWPMLFLPDSIALLVVSSLFTGAILGFVLTEVQGFTKLLGLMHIPWIPMVILQIQFYLGSNLDGQYKLWLQCSIIVTLISLVIDIWDVVMYLKGNRDDLLKTNS